MPAPLLVRGAAPPRVTARVALVAARRVLALLTRKGPVPGVPGPASTTVPPSSVTVPARVLADSRVRVPAVDLVKLPEPVSSPPMAPGPRFRVEPPRTSTLVPAGADRAARLTVWAASGPVTTSDLPSNRLMISL